MKDQHQGVIDMDTRLREAGRDRYAHTPAGLHGRIMAAVQAAASLPAPHAHHYLLPAWSFALAAIAVVALGVTLTWRHLERRTEAEWALSALATCDLHLHDAAATLPDAATGPIERELAHLTHDIRQGTSFLLSQVR